MSMESGISLVKQHFSVRDHLQKLKSRHRGVHKANSKQFLTQGRTTTKEHVKITFHSINQYGKMDKNTNPARINFHAGV
jgi:hypothetical protein